MNIPPILMEGDLPPAPKVAGPGARYALGTYPLSSVLEGSSGALPEGYGTRQLFLTARDPRWLYASWDLTHEQGLVYNRRSRDGHLILRVFAGGEDRPVVPEIHVHPEARTFFINVPMPETQYRAELGFYNAAGNWERVSSSGSTFTPPDAPSAELGVEFASIPAEVSFEDVVQTVQEFVTEHRPLLEAVAAAQETLAQETQAQQAQATPPAVENEPEPIRQAVRERRNEPPASLSSARAQTEPELPPNFERPVPRPESHPTPEVAKRAPTQRSRLPITLRRAPQWSPARIEALRQLIHIDSYRRVWMGSIEITELVRRQMREDVASMAAAGLSGPAAVSGEGRIGNETLALSSPGERIPARSRRFWFKINAELILYGATESDARVTVAGRPVKLRPDGTFSFRFALPDGRYDLPAEAASADGAEVRAAHLEFSRATEYRGSVEAHPQDASLKAPRRENL